MDAAQISSILENPTREGVLQFLALSDLPPVIRTLAYTQINLMPQAKFLEVSGKIRDAWDLLTAGRKDDFINNLAAAGLPREMAILLYGKFQNSP